MVQIGYHNQVNTTGCMQLDSFIESYHSGILPTARKTQPIYWHCVSSSRFKLRFFNSTCDQTPHSLGSM